MHKGAPWMKSENFKGLCADPMEYVIAYIRMQTPAIPLISKSPPGVENFPHGLVDTCMLLTHYATK